MNTNVRYILLSVHCIGAPIGATKIPAHIGYGYVVTNLCQLLINLVETLEDFDQEFAYSSTLNHG